MPVEAVHELPLSVEKLDAGAPAGAHTTRLPSAAAATVPPPFDAARLAAALEPVRAAVGREAGPVHVRAVGAVDVARRGR